MSTEKPKIACLANGPYLLSNDSNPHVTVNIQNSKGAPISPAADIALCRCGASNNKPFCDGSHSKSGFTDEKLADATPDKRDSYAGKMITIHDNRGICAHAGFCTNNLSSVFKYKEEPWIDPDAATVNEIIDAIATCPSGALSYTIENTAQQEPDCEPMITITKDGPYAITGNIELLDQAMGKGCSQERYTLCRCGASKNKPFCDGSHWGIGFKDEIN